jgi:hypothetical protein
LEPEDATITHIFSLSGIRPTEAARQPHEVLLLGRYGLHVAGRPDDNVRIHTLEARPVEVTADGATLGDHLLAAEVWFDGSGLVQLHLRQRVRADHAEVARMLKTFCHQRDVLELDGLSIAAWTRSRLGTEAEMTLAQDVLQIVDYPTALQDTLSAGDEPSGAALAIVYRDPSMSALSVGSIRMPAELNREPLNFGAHGRGVLLLSGHSPERQTALRLTACELLFAVGRARRARASIETRLRAASELTALDGPWRDVEFLQALGDDVRRQRIVLALDVRAYADGLFMPELVIDSFRDSFGEALRLRTITESSLNLVDTLTDVVQSFLEEAKLLASTEVARRQRNWHLIVGLASGVAIPIALLLSYFGVSSQINAPAEASIFDLGTYALPWLVTLGATVAIIALSYRQHRMNRA